MPTISTSNFPTTLHTRMINAIADEYNYPETVRNPNFDPQVEEGPDNLKKIPNPQTKVEFAVRIADAHFVAITQANEANKAKNVAEKAERVKGKKDFEDFT